MRPAPRRPYGRGVRSTRRTAFHGVPRAGRPDGPSTVLRPEEAGMARIAVATSVAAGSAALVAAAPAHAAITATSGEVEKNAQPANPQIGALESALKARAWDEAQSHRLTAPLAVEATPAGPGTTIPDGTWVSSHMIHADQ